MWVREVPDDVRPLEVMPSSQKGYLLLRRDHSMDLGPREKRVTSNMLPPPKGPSIAPSVFACQQPTNGICYADPRREPLS